MLSKREEHAQYIRQWLIRYPYQRAADIAIAMADRQSRASVYRTLGALEQESWIESCLPAIAQGSRLYYASLLPGESRAARKQTLLRLLPRLTTWLPLQESINGIITGASQAFIKEGHHAHLVCWDWQRDLMQTFSFQGRPMRLFLDGSCQFLVRFPPDDRDSWYSLLWLTHPLITEMARMRARIEAILRWRESAACGSAHQQMPPLLILATTPRQAQWWHQAACQAATALQVDLPRGAVACMTAGQTPWHWDWHSLGEKRPCHLQEVLVARPEPVFPLVTPQVVTDDHQPHRRIGLDQTYRTTGKIHAFLRLLPRHWEILQQILAHPLLSEENVEAFLAMKHASLAPRLKELQDMDYLASISTTAGERWYLTPGGLRLMAVASRTHVYHMATFRSPSHQVGSTLRQRGIDALFQQIQHTAGIYGFFADLCTASHHWPEARLRFWESGPICARSFRVQDKTQVFQPDALAEYQDAEGQVFRFWLEWDRGTINGRDILRKFHTYASYIEAQAWASDHPVLPTLLYVVPESDQERRVSTVAHKLLHTSSLLMLTTTMGLLAKQGVGAAIWQPVSLRTPNGEQTTRVSVFGPPRDGREELWNGTQWQFSQIL